MSTKQLETISGAVEQVNAKGTGIKVAGEWLNISQYHPIVPMPTAGELVEVQVERSERGAWINSLRILGGATVAPGSDRTTTRLAVLQAAATFCGGKAISNEVSSKDVLAIADAWLAWIDQEPQP